MSQHKSAAVLDHPDNSVTDAKLGQRTVLTTSGPLQTLLTAIGNAIKAISGADTWNGTPATTLKDAKTHMGDAVKHITAQERESWNTAATDRHSHTNKSVLDGITAAMVTAWNTVSSKLPLAGGTLTGFLTLHAAPATDMHAATKKYVDDKMAASGSGDMTKAVYDPGGRELPYIPKQDVDALAWGGDFGASGTPVSIAYAGAQRIASITAYGENAQGGTTEAPVALTGVEDVFVGGKNLLPKATKTQTIYGVTFTPNPDGSVSVSGTCAGGIATYNYADNLVPISPNQVVYLSGASQLVKVVINEKTPSRAFVRNVLVDRGQGRHWPLLWEVAYLARAFKDMIVQEADGKPRLTFRNRQGAAVLEDVAVEVSSTVQQQGDAWGALAANLLLELDDDGVPILKLDGGTY